MNVIYVFIILCVVIQACVASTTLVVCGSHGTNDPPREQERQCMKVRPLQDRVLASIPVPTCNQIDPPSLQLETGAQDDEERTREEHNGGVRHRRLPKKLFVGNLPFALEMEVNSETAVWWNHVQEQDDGCSETRGEPESLRLHRVDVLVVDDDDYTCQNYTDAQDNLFGEADENGVASIGQRVHILLRQVLIGSVDLNLAAGGTAMTQIVTLLPSEVLLYVDDGSGRDIEKRWHRNEIG